MEIVCVIPSRIGSTRLARKALLPIRGKPMVQCVYEAASSANFISRVVVATDSDEIAGVISNIGGEVVMTPADVPTGSDRVALVAANFPEAEVVINLQGDEPFITSEMLRQLVHPYLHGERPPMTTLAYPLNHESAYHDPNYVKVITDQHHNAIYFSRSPIPYFRTKATVPVYHHIGLYAFTREFLLNYTSLPVTPLEKAESLEQLRAIEHGYKIRVCITEEKTLEINTSEEYELAQNFAG